MTSSGALPPGLTLAPSAGPPSPPAASRGLASEEAERLRERYGPNEVAAGRAASPLRDVARGLASPLILILIAASVVAASVGERADAAIIVLMIALSVTLNAIQTYRSQSAANALRQQVAPTATVLRDGAWQELARRELVPGDTIRLSAGDLVPADARLLTSRDLHVQQAALTGESLPVEKEAAPAAGGAPDARAAPVKSTDPRARDIVFLGTSVVSGIATAVVTATGASTGFGEIAARLGSRPPETEFERGLRSFGLLITQTVVFLVLFLVLVSVALHRDPLESLLFATALAVGIVPEFMPMITSVTLATGAVRMARQKVIVRHLAAIQNFGSIDVLCSDKTGTLTAGEMRLEGTLDAAERTSAHVLELGRLNACLQTGIRSPLDVAIEHSGDGTPAGWEQVDEIPFDFERRRVSIVARRGDERLLVTKGAPEALLACCSAYEDGPATAPLDDAALARIVDMLHRLGGEGLRVLGVASRRMPERTAYSIADEADLTFAGVLTFADPPLADVPETISALRADGVEIKILTGDELGVARHVCQRTGLNVAQMAVGSDIDHLSDTALGILAERTTVFARVSPAQKLRILLALKGRGHVVGYLGDGINDAPTLHAADVGISVAGAVDVAREAADIVLLERGLGVLHSGIVEGRKAFGNVIKYLLMGTSSNFGNMFSMAAASLFLPFLPMLPTQILLNNFLYDLAQVAIPTDRVDDAYVRKPHKWNVAGLRRFMLAIGPISSVFDIVTFVALLKFFHAGEALFHTGWFVESLVTQVLVLFVIRTAGNPLRSRPSTAFTVSALLALLVGVALPFSPAAGVLGFVAPSAAYGVFVVAVTLCYLLLVDAAKRRIMPALVG